MTPRVSSAANPLRYRARSFPQKAFCLIALSIVFLYSPARADTACSPEAVAGLWVLQSTNSVIAAGAVEGAYSPFVRGPGSGSVFTAFAELHEDGSATLEEQFIRGHRAGDITLVRSDANAWSVDAGCNLEMSGTLTTGEQQHPHRLQARLSMDGARLQGVREIEDQYSRVKLIYAITGDRL